MNSYGINDIPALYSNMFSHLEAGSALEGQGEWSKAYTEFAFAVNTIAILVNLERDPAKQSLLYQQMQTFRKRADDLSHRIVLDLPVAPGKTPAPAPAAAAAAPAAPVESKKTPNAEDKAAADLTEASRLFAEALEMDESNTSKDKVLTQTTITKYLDVAALYLKLSGQGRRVGQILDRVEELKLSLTEPTFSDPASLESLLPVAPVVQHTDVGSSGKSAKTVILKPESSAGGSGERWLGAAKKGTTADFIPDSATVASSGAALTAMEIAVLRASSVVNGRVFQPWLPDEEERERFRYDHPFCDPDGLLPLSAKQIAGGAEWRRPREFVLADKPTMIEVISPLSIRQDLVSDCSFVCSLCIASAFEARYKKQLITGIIYPQNASKKPIYNAFGKYLVKLYINGVQRKVVVDDRLPVCAATGKLLCAMSSDPKELWVSIVEKAYMKVNGGYDFPGSNSGIDLYALTGWIPEHIYFSEDSERKASADSLDHRQSEDRAWERIKSAHGFGDCLVTIATGELTAEQEEATGLVPGHAYAVLDVKEAGTLRMLRVKNPWSCRPWKGRFSSSDRRSWTSGLRAALNITEKDFEAMETHGLFWIEFNDCRRFYKSFFLNWNPALFSFRTVFHDFWPASQGPRNDRYFVGDNPQYSLTVDNRGKGSAKSHSEGGPNTSRTIWILLSRHVTQTESKEKVRVTEARDGRDGDFLTLHVYRVKGARRVYCNTTPSIKGLYTNDPHILTRIDVDSVPFCDDELEADREDASTSEEAFTLVVSQIEKSRDVSFTLTVLGTTPYRFYSAVSPPPHKLDLAGAWTTMTGGGAPSEGSFYINPQVVVGGSSKLQVHIQLTFPKEISAALYLVKGGIRLDSIATSEEVASSGAYRPGYCFLEASLSPGAYTLVPATFRRQMLGQFLCCVRSSSTTIGVAELAPEGQRGFKMAVRGEWSFSSGTAVGCSNYGSYHLNPLFVFQLQQVSKFTCRLRPADEASIAALNVSLYDLSSIQRDAEETNQNCLPRRANPKKSTFSSCGGVYTDKPSGVVIADVELSVGTWALVPSTFEPTEMSFDLNISFSSTSQVPIQRLR